MTSWAYSVKPAAFSEERECRLVAFPKIGDKTKSSNGVLVRPTPQLLLPSMILKPRADEKLPIVESRCGPARFTENQGKQSVSWCVFTAIPRCRTLDQRFRSESDTWLAPKVESGSPLFPLHQFHWASRFRRTPRAGGTPSKPCGEVAARGGFMPRLCRGDL
jgi:hypothetical protein